MAYMGERILEFGIRHFVKAGLSTNCLQITMNQYKDHAVSTTVSLLFSLNKTKKMAERVGFEPTVD